VVRAWTGGRCARLIDQSGARDRLSALEEDEGAAVLAGGARSTGRRSQWLGAVVL
jgi:hypothetical protein